ncbi:hypothetical protein [Salinicoccus sp. HZC-1]|uniref:hypothetical protein n=1 Tax=Salinicoccus sp. HZC-1 TaxID=3385497 RepID=UPI00398B7C7E
MSRTVITRLEIMLPESLELYLKGTNGVKSIYDDGDGFSIIFEDDTVRFFNNAVPLKVDWEMGSEQDGV